MKSIMSNTPGPPRTPLPSFASLSRQTSIYTLTLQEFQQTVHEPGKNFGSTNMEEFMKNIWTAEENQAMANAMSGTVEGQGAQFTAGTPGGSLHHQSSISFPMNLSGKTVEEVWKEIHRSSNNDQSNATNSIQRKKTTMGETTLEEFLTKAGVVRDDPDAQPSYDSANSTVNSIVTHSSGQVRGRHEDGIQATQMSPPQWFNFPSRSNLGLQKSIRLQQPPPLVHQHQLQQQQQAEAAADATFKRRLVAPGTGGISSPVRVTNTIGNSFNTATALGSGSLSQSSAVVSDRKRPFEGHKEKVIEQRQKRMIKNRESAARSRAKKQAYTVDLETEMTQLKEENAKLLQQQVEIMENRRKKLLEILVPVTSQIQKTRHALRRTRTTCW